MWRSTCWKRNTKYYNQVPNTIPSTLSQEGEEYLTWEETPSTTPKYQITSTKYFISRWGRSTYQLPRTPSSGGSQVQGSLSCSHGSVFDPPSHFSSPHPCLWVIRKVLHVCRLSRQNLTMQNIPSKQYWLNCGFCSNRILPYFPLSVRPCVTGLTSPISHIYKALLLGAIVLIGMKYEL